LRNSFGTIPVTSLPENDLSTQASLVPPHIQSLPSTHHPVKSRVNRGGVPAAIRGMLEAASAEAEVTRSTVRAFMHRAGVRYMDMTPTLVLGLMAVVAGRYIASGTNSNELYILSGIGIALFIGVRLLMFKLK